MDKFEIGKAIKKARTSKLITAKELAAKAQIPPSSLSDWENGKATPSAESMFRICEALSITPSDILSIANNNEFTYDTKIKSVKIPVLGSIPAGIPIEAVEEIVDYEEITQDLANTGKFFGLRVKGNSMSPIIQDGDTVIIRQQEDADSGKICVVMINGYDATLKEIKKDPNGIWILPKNPDSDFKPTFFTKQEIIEKPVRIIGVAIEIRRSL